MHQEGIRLDELRSGAQHCNDLCFTQRVFCEESRRQKLSVRRHRREAGLLRPRERSLDCGAGCGVLLTLSSTIASWIPL